MDCVNMVNTDCVVDHLLHFICSNIVGNIRKVELECIIRFITLFGIIGRWIVGRNFCWWQRRHLIWRRWKYILQWSLRCRDQGANCCIQLIQSFTHLSHFTFNRVNFGNNRIVYWIHSVNSWTKTHIFHQHTAIIAHPHYISIETNIRFFVGKSNALRMEPTDTFAKTFANYYRFISATVVSAWVAILFLSVTPYFDTWFHFSELGGV